MAIDGAILRAMQAAGASIEVIIAAVEADAALENERIESRRAKDAERQRRHRSSRDVIVTERDTALRDVTDSDPSLSRPPNEINSNPPTHTHPESETPRARGPWDFHVSAWKEWRLKHPFPKPWWAEEQAWDDWMEVRHAKKARNTVTAHNGFLADVAKHTDAEWPPGKLLKHAAARSWLSINRPEEHLNGRYSRTSSLPSPADNRGTRRNPLVDILAGIQAEGPEDDLGDDGGTWAPLRAIGTS